MRDPCLVVVLLLAAGLRLYGIDHGLPFIYNPDEANIMARALSVARDLDPGYYLYPSFYFYFLFAVMGALFVLGKLVGRYESLAAFQARFFEDPTDFYIVGRLVGVLAALLTIVLTYRLATKHFGRTAARAAALFVAIAYFHVRDSHYLKHDVPSGLLLVAALWAIDRAMTEKTRAAYLVAGVAVGVGFAMHYYMIFLAPTFLVCHWMSRRWDQFSDLLLAGLSSAVTFFVLSPFVLLKFPVAIGHMRANREVVVDRSLDIGASLFPSLGRYVDFLLVQGLGYVLAALTLAGFVVMARRGVARLALWGVFPTLFFAFLAYTFFAGRYLNPILPCLAVAAGLSVATIEARVGSLAALTVALVACLQPFYHVVRVDRLFAGEDTRTLARRWIIDHVASNETLALQSFSVPLPQSAASFRESLQSNGAMAELERRGKYASLLEAAESEKVAYRLFFFGSGDEPNRIYLGYGELEDGLGPLRELGVRTVLLRNPPGEPAPPVAALFDRVRTEGRRLLIVSPFQDDDTTTPYLDNEDWPPSAGLSHKGPLIEIWALELD